MPDPIDDIAGLAARAALGTLVNELIKNVLARTMT